MVCLHGSCFRSRVPGSLRVFSPEPWVEPEDDDDKVPPPTPYEAVVERGKPDDLA